MDDPSLMRQVVEWFDFLFHSTLGYEHVEKGAVELAPLPSPGFYSRLFVVMKASGSWRPVIDLSTLNLLVLKSLFKMETSVCASVCAEWRLDGVSGLKGRLLASSNPSGQLQVCQVRCLRTGVPVQCSVFWFLHGSTSLHEDHGSSIDLSSSCGDQGSSLPRRLADPGSLSVSSYPSPGHGAVAVSGLEDHSNLGEVESSSISACGVPGFWVRYLSGLLPPSQK